jgi:signal transduction histidine kinase
VARWDGASAIGCVLAAGRPAFADQGRRRHGHLATTGTAAAPVACSAEPREGPELDTKTTSTSRSAPAGAPEDREAKASAGRSQQSARDRLADVACVGVAVLLGSLFILGSLAETPPQPVQLGWELVFGGSACVALLLLRRRWPVALALVLILASPLSALGLGAALMAAFTVATRRPWRVTAAVGGLLAAVFTSAFALAARTSYEYWSAAATVLFLLAALLAWGMLVRSQRLLVQSLEERARQAEEGQQLRVQEARRLERERIAREMHDVLAHRISLLTLHAGALEFSPGASPEEIARAAGVIRSSAFEAAEDLREVIGVLRKDDDTVDPERPQPTLTDLPQLLDQSRRAGMPVTMENRLADPGAVPAGIGRHAYRIVQEALTNARKHAPGAPVRVTVAGGPGAGLTVEVRNRLLPNAATEQVAGTGAGLVGLAERVGLVHGQLEHGPTPDGDFQLRARLPWPP